MRGSPTGWVPVLTTIVALAGCATEDLGQPAEPQLPPEDRADAAMDRFVTAFENLGEDSDIVGFELRLEIKDPDRAGMFDLEGPIEMAFEMGSNDVNRVTVGLGPALGFEVYCGSELTVIVLNGDAFASRPGSAEGCDEQFRKELTGEQFDGPPGSEDNLTLADAGEIPGGGVEANYTYRGDDGQRVSLLVRTDAQGRVVALITEDRDARGEFRILYAPGREVQMPQAQVRIPANIGYDESFDAGTYAWEAYRTAEAAPLSDFEIRIRQLDANGDWQVLATFDPAAGPQQAAAFAFEFHDDGDRLMSAGDSFTVQHPTWVGPSSVAGFEYVGMTGEPDAGPVYDVQVYDRWAGMDIEENPIPVPWPFVIPGMLGLALSRRRR